MIFNLRIFKKLTKFGVPSPEFMKRILLLSVFSLITVFAVFAQTLTIDTPISGGFVNAAEDGALVITGTSSGLTDQTEVTVTISDGVNLVSTTATIGASWTAAAADLSTALPLAISEGTVTVDAITDGTPIIATQVTFEYDKTAPTPVISSGESDPTNSDPISFQVDFGETVSGFAEGDITVNNGTVTSSSLSGGVGGLYSFTVDPTADGTVTVDIAGSVATDAAGNNNNAATQFSIEYDGTAPNGYTVAFDQDPVNIANETSIGFTFAGAETGTTYDYTISSSGGGTDVTGSGAVGSATENVASIDVSGLNDGTLTLTVTLTDDAGNIGADATDNAVYDATAPTPVISSGESDPTNSDPISFQVDFGETVSGFAEGDITVNNGTVTSTSLSGGVGGLYSFTVDPTADGTVNVDIAGSVATDAAGNNNNAATQFSIEYDGTAPNGYTVTFDQDPVNIGNETSIGFTFAGAEVGTTYDYTISSSGGGTDVTGSGPIGAAAENVAGINVSGLNDGTLTLTVALTDDAGNIGTDATDNAAYDATAPTPIISSGESDPTNSDPISFQVDFGETVSGFAEGDITVDNGTVTSSSLSGGVGGLYSFTVDPTADGTVTVDIAGSVATDAAGNNNNAATQYSIDYDGTPPVVDDLEVFDTDNDGYIDEIIIYFDENVDTDDGAAPVLADLGTITLPDGQTITTAAGLSISDPQGLTNQVTISGISDQVTANTGVGSTSIDNIDGLWRDNVGNITNTASDDSENIIDSAAPIILAAVTSDNNNNGFLDRLTLTFSENIDDGNSGAFTNTTVDVAGYTGEAKVSGDDDNAEVIISFTEGGTPDTDATPSVTLLSGQVEDAVSNAIASSQIFSSTEDGAAPIIVSAVTFDADLNGFIDGALITLSENIDESNPGNDLDNSTFDVSYSGENATTGATPNDNIVELTFNEGGVEDTDATPNITLNSADLYDFSGNVLGSNQVFSGTEDGAVPIIILGNNPEPDEEDSNVDVNDSRIISFSFSEDIDAIGGHNIYIYNTDDLINPVVEADVTNPSISIAGSTITWDHNELLDKGESYVVGIDAGAFEDESASTLPTLELETTGDVKWQWSMQGNGNPGFVYSPQHGTSGSPTTLPPFGRVYFYFDEPVRIMNSADRDMDADIIDNWAGSKDSDEFTVDIDNDDGQPGEGNGTSPTSIYPLHTEPDNPANYTKEKIFDISDISYNSGNGYKTSGSPIYRLSFPGGSFEDVGDGDSDSFIIEFQIDGSDATRPSITSFVPIDDVDDPANDPIDIESTTTLTINFDEDIVAGFGNIKLFANLDPDVQVLDIPATSSLVDIVGDQVTIDISGITLSGNVEYYINIDKGAFTDVPGNTFAGFSDETTWNFLTETETNAPVVSSLSPADNATGVDVDSDLTITFNEPVKQGVGGNLNIRLSSNGYIVETVSSSSFTFDGTNVTIPLDRLGGLSGYYVNIDQDAIADLGDNKFPGISGSFAWSFTTASESDAPVAQTSTFSPAHTSSGAAVGTNISFFFDEVVSPIAGKNITIYIDDGVPTVFETFDVTDPGILVSGNQVVINPSTDLDFVEDYYIEIESGAFEDASGNITPALGGDGIWNFQTGVDTSNPYIVSTTPTNAASGIASGTITINMNETVTATPGKKIALYDATVDTLIQEIDGADAEVNVATNVATINFSTGFTTNGLNYYIAMDKGFFRDQNSNDIEDINPGEWTFSAQDNTPPTVVITRNAVTNGSFNSTNDATISFDIAFSEPIDAASFDDTNITVSSGGTANLGTVNLNNDADDRYYTFSIPVNSGDGDVSITINAGSLTDQNGQVFVGPTSSSIIHVDQVVPTVGLTLASDNASPSTLATTGDVVTLTMDFDDELSGPPTVTMLSGGDVLNNAPTILETNGDPFYIWTASYTVSPLDSDGAIEFDVSFVDDGGNAGAAVDETAVGNTLVVDKVEPTTLNQSVSVLGSDVTLTTSLNEPGTVYYMFSSTPYADPATLRADAIGAGNTIDIPSASTNYQIVETLSNNTATTVYLVGEDIHGNLMGAVSNSSVQTGGVTLSNPTLANLCNSSLTDYTLLSDITIDETINNDFRVGSGITFRIKLPTGFEFNTAAGSASATGADITVQPVLDFPDVDELRITYTVAGTATDDQITITGLEVKATDSPLSAVTLSRSGGSAVVYGAEESDNRVFGTLTSINPPATPTITTSKVVSNELVVSTGDDLSIQTTTSGGTISWYNYDYSSSQTGNPILLSGMPAPGGGTGFQANNGLYTLYFTEVLAGCESEPDKFNVLVRGYFQDPAGNSFVDDAGDIDIAISKPANHTVTFTGTGLFDPSTTADSSKVKFSPSTAGTGDHDILITTNNNNTGESLGYTETFSISTTAQIFAVPLDVDYCQDGGVLSVNPRLDDIPGGYSFYGMYLDGALISPPPGWNSTRDDNPTTGWFLDLSTVSPGQHKIQRRICRTPASIFNPPQATNIVYLQADLDVYRVPSVSLSNLPEYICEDDLPLELDADILNINLNGSSKALNTVDLASYLIEKLTGEGTEGGPYSRNVTGDVLDPSDPMNDGRDPVGEYRITYTSSTDDDPNFPSAIDGKGCNDVDVRTIYIQAVPDLPELTTDLTGIGGENGDRINLQFCVGEVIPDLVVSADPDEQITWYTSNLLNTTYNSIGAQGEILEAEELFGTDEPNSAFNVNIYVTKTDYVNADGLGFEGCESPAKIINIRVYEDPTLPEIDVTQEAATRINSSSYLFEYCDSYGGDNVTFSSVLPDGEAYYRLFDQGGIHQKDTATNLLEFSNFDFAGAKGTDTTIFISRVLNDSTWFDSGAQFQGCESGLISLEIRVYETSPAPDTTLFATNRTDYYICSGEDLGTITSPGEQDTRYAWYQDDGSGTAPDYDSIMDVSAFDARFIVQNSLVNEFDNFSNENLTTSPVTYTYWVTQFQDYNDQTGYIGCESEPSKITITVFPDPAAPTFDDPGVTYMDWDVANAHRLDIAFCEGNIGQSIELNLNGNTDAVFNWYRSDATGTTRIGNSVHDHLAGEAVKTSELKITDAEEADGLIYFVVTQTNNSQPLGADFDGCETELDEMAFVIINTYDIPAMPETIDGDYTYCEDDVFANGIELTGEAGVTFNWYKADVDGNMESTPFHTGSTANDTELGLLGDNGTGRYLFWVTQTQNIGDGVATFEGCESEPQQIIIYEVPPEMDDIRFSSDYIASSEGFCVDILQGSVIINYSGVEDALFTWYDHSMSPIVERTLSPETFFNTGASGVGTYTFYVSQTINSCESALHEVTFNIYDTPDTPEFDLASNGTLINPQYEFIYCRDQDISNETLLISNGQTGNKYEWYFDENLTESITQNIDESDQSIEFTNLGVSGVDGDQLAKTPGTYSRYVRVQESTQCYSLVRRFDLVVGEAPEVAFIWDGLMEGKPIDFTFINENQAVEASDIDEVRFTVGADIPYHELTYAENQTYDTTFTEAGEYTVELFMRTSDVCRDSVTRTVTVLDVIKVPEDGLLETFEDTEHGWFAEYRTLDGKLDTLVSSWELGEPSTSTLNNAFSGDNAWVTNLDGDYASNEISWVYSPAFDITSLTIPIVSFYHQHWLFNNRDAVVFQYSTDNGTSWFKLGDFSEIAGGIVETSGLNWYTHADIPTQPGYYNVNSVDFNQSYNPSSFGWSSTQQSVQRQEDRVSDWLLSINKMDNADTVIFRFALSSSGGDEDEGFAFDDFRVYNSDKITMLESFYNASETGVVAAYQDLREQVDNQSIGSVAWINYFTELDMTSSTGRDDINRSNSIDPSARVGYYGIDEAPRSALEGELQKLEGIDTGSELYIRGFTPSALGVAGLESKKFDITNFQLDTSAPSDILRVSATFTAVQDFPESSNEFSIRFMVIEKEITGVSVGEFSENDTLRNVLRKILPSAGGIIKQGAMELGTSFTETVEWKINNVYDPTQLDVIAFIQNENATNGRREIFQAAVLNGDFSNKELILGVLDQLRNGDPFVIYPNPVDDAFKLEILNPVKESMDWKMFDQTGKEVLTGQLPGGELSIDIETKQLPSGVFLLYLIPEEGEYEPKRIVVVHQ